MARQTKVKSEKSVKRCSLCGARMWQWDDMRQIWSGPWHFNWCSEVPGGDDKRAADIEHDMRYAEEKVVPREMGRRILKAIFTMLESPDRDTMLKTKAAIQERLGKL